MLISTFSLLQAQKVTFGTDLMNRYVWRGLDLGGRSPSIQPYASIKFGTDKHTLTLGAWSAFSTASTCNDEIDISLTYAYNDCLNLTLTDYFFPGLYTGMKEKYFEWSADSTGHLLEGTFNFSGTEKVPFTFLVAMNFYGNDARKINGDLFMSKYIEFGYKKSFEEFDFNPFIGAALDSPDTEAGETAYYLNKKAGIVNIGLKCSRNIAITDKFSLPVQCSLITNPDMQKIYFTFGISL